MSLGLAPVNDAPFIEAIEYGRPIYGYQWSLEALYDGEGYVSGYQWQLNAVRNQATANMLAWQTGVIASPQWWSGGGDTRPAGLVDADGNRMTFSYYRNGSMRPIAWDNRDATEIYTDDYGNPSYMALRRPGAEQRACDRLRHRRSVGPNHVQYRKRTCPRACGGACLCAVLGVCLYINPKYAYQYAVFEPGAWQYFAHPGDEYTGADPFTVTVTGADGASTTVTLTPQHYGTSLGGGRKPVALDLDGNGLQFVNLDNSNVYFDVNGDGWREHIAWVAPEDGLLALDLEGDGVIDRIEEISFVAYQPGARTDLEGLRAFDTDGNGVLDRLGARWGRVRRLAGPRQRWHQRCRRIPKSGRDGHHGDRPCERRCRAGARRRDAVWLQRVHHAGRRNACRRRRHVPLHPQDATASGKPTPPRPRL